MRNALLTLILGAALTVQAAQPTVSYITRSGLKIDMADSFETKVSKVRAENQRLQAERPVSREEEPAMVTPVVIVNGPEDPSWEWDCSRSMIIIDNNVNMTITDFGEFGAPCEAFWPVPEGEYLVTVDGRVFHDGEFYAIGQVKTTANFTAESNTVEINFSDMTVNIGAEAYLPDGSLFPQKMKGNSDIILWMDGNMLICTSQDDVFSRIMTSPVTCHSYITAVAAYQDTPDHSFISTAKVDGPFVEDIVVVNDKSLYADYTTRVCLTDADLASGWAGQVTEYMVNQPSFTPTTIVTMGVEGVAADTYSVTAIIPEASLVTEDFQGYTYGVAMGAVVGFWDGRFVSKLGGNYANIGGKIKVVPDMDNTAYCFKCPEMMILDVPERFFDKAMFASASLNFYLNRENMTIDEVNCNLKVKGPQHEKVNNIYGAQYIKGLKINGVEMTREEIVGTPYTSGDNWEVVVEYDNLTVDGEIPTSTELAMGFRANDYSAPQIGFNYYQVIGADGKITNKITKGENSNLYVVVMNDGGKVPTTVSLVPQTGGDAIELTAVGEPEECDYNWGLLYTYDLSSLDLKEGEWYKAVVNIDNGDGVFRRHTLNHCLMCKPASSIEAAVANGAEIVSTQWYDLQGRRVDNPANGLYIKSVTLSDGSLHHVKTIR